MQALDYYHRKHGSESDTATEGSSVTDDIKDSSGFSELVNRIQTQRITKQLASVSIYDDSGNLPPNDGLTAYIGFVDLVVGRTSIFYTDTTSWTASDWVPIGNMQERLVTGETTLEGTNKDTFNFTSNPDDEYLTNLIEEVIPGAIAGNGTSFNLSGNFEYEFETSAVQAME